MNVEFIDMTEVDPRAIRRLAASRNVPITRMNGMWDVRGLLVDDDDAWSLLSV